MRKICGPDKQSDGSWTITTNTDYNLERIAFFGKKSNRLRGRHKWKGRTM